MIAQIELLDEVNCKIHNLSTATRRKLNNKFSYMLPHAFHVPAFKLGRWDGKETFFTIAAATYVNLLDDIVPILLTDGYEIELIDNRVSYDISLSQIEPDHFSSTKWPENHPVAGTPVILRDYQTEIINKFLSNTSSIQCVATGAGKTLITAALSNIVESSLVGEDAAMHKLKHGHNRARTIVIVPNKGLVTQTEEDYINLGLDVGVYYGDRKDYGKTHTICTWQSLEIIQKNFREGKIDHSLEDFTAGVMAVIIDEAHGSKAKVLRKMLTGPFKNIPIRWGLTGTIPKAEHERIGLTVGVGSVVGELAAKTLQDDGVLSNCHVDILQFQDDIAYDNYQTELSYLTTNSDRLDYMADAILAIASTGNTLVLVDRVKSGEGLVERLPADRTVFISGKMKNELRKEYYDEIAKNNDKIIIATYGVAAVGLNIPRIFNMVLIEPGKSFVRVIQSIGRGLRTAKDKSFVKIYDITSSAKYAKRHLTQRKKFYKESQYPFKITKMNWKDDVRRQKEVLADIVNRKEPK